MSSGKRPYSRFAEVYDLMGADYFSVNMVEYTFKLLSKFKHHPETILEMCCGTGTAAMMFAEEGYEVSALDGSKEMLRMARKKAKEHDKKIKFYHQTLPNLEIKKRGGKTNQAYDLITCFYDSLNYLTKKQDLIKCFKRVRNHLNPDGLFIFDMNTYNAFTNVWSANIYSGCLDDIAWIWKARVNEKKRTADLRAIFFLKKGRLWEKFEENHTEKAYACIKIKKMLGLARLEVLGFYRCFTMVKPDLKTTRIAVVARRKE